MRERDVNSIKDNWRISWGKCYVHRNRLNPKCVYRVKTL